MRNLLVQALGLHQRGALSQAEGLYRQVLKVHPKNPDALRLCGMVCSQQGKNEEARALLKKAVEAAPTSAEAHNALGKVLNDLGRYEEGERQCRIAIGINPRFAEAYDNLGNTLTALDRLDEAEKAYRKAIEISPKNATFHNNLGGCLAVSGQSDAAAACYVAALNLNPGFEKPVRNLAAIANRILIHDPVIESLTKALDTQKRSLPLLTGLGDILVSAGRSSEAVPYLLEALEKDPEAAGTLLSLASAYLELNQAEEATDYLERAFTELQRNKVTLLRVGWLYSRMGDFDRAESWFIDAHEADPKAGHALYNLANIKRIEVDDPYYERARAIADDENASDYDRSQASFAVADMLDRAKRYDEAFVYLKRANDFVQAPKTDWEAKLKNLEDFAKVFTPAFFESFEEVRSPEATPIFVVGMPRSGTTLTEQILARHPQVSGAGELTEIPSGLHKIGMTHNAANYPAFLKGVSAEQVAGAARSYLSVLRDIGGGDSSRIVDKLPGNAWFLGWVHLLFPKATIIHCNRNLMDVALSCYRASFSSLGWAFRQEDIAQQIHRHLKSMEVWREILPTKIVELSYEELVSDPENEIPKLIEAAGLPWHPDCLNQNSRATAQVKTASMWQARQPISAQSVERWRRYEKGLAPLRDRLVEFGDLAADA